MEQEKEDYLEILKKQLKPHKNTLVLRLGVMTVAELIDVVYDEDDNEFYWVFKNNNYDVDDITHESILLEWMPIKDYLPASIYEKICNHWYV